MTHNSFTIHVQCLHGMFSSMYSYRIMLEMSIECFINCQLCEKQLQCLSTICIRIDCFCINTGVSSTHTTFYIV
jgi:hypothetical protein